MLCITDPGLPKPVPKIVVERLTVRSGTPTKERGTAQNQALRRGRGNWPCQRTVLPWGRPRNAELPRSLLRSAQPSCGSDAPPPLTIEGHLIYRGDGASHHHLTPRTVACSFRRDIPPSVFQQRLGLFRLPHGQVSLPRRSRRRSRTRQARPGEIVKPLGLAPK